jgi:hypothetical protein
MTGSGSEEMEMGNGSQSGSGYVKVEPGQVTYCFNMDVSFMGHDMHFGWSGTAGKDGFSQHGDGYMDDNEGSVDMGDDVDCGSSDGNW